MSRATDELKAHVDLVALIGSTVQLRRSGWSYRGACPIGPCGLPHPAPWDHARSLVVHSRTRHWRCYVCGAGGSALNWLMARDGITMRQAVEALQVSAAELQAQSSET